MTSPFEISDDPEVDFLQRGNEVEILLDLRFRDVNLSNVEVRSDSKTLYVYDRSSNNVIKIVTLPFRISSISVNSRNGILVIKGMLEEINSIKPK
ncbi:hypothetical protein [Sulfuracidifex tepidarius]|uniref:ArsA HSP20-like domain-containing protein n=1 Tax=Sulfuracidifex tepidarius TaxID=1294262 RepID=A0A510DVX7_9CREN|nr:hypothetical protein [Sulfuracidifex tepidarius]BBG24334.1 hypothetical protein IC006_1644 [Sulfuracidifex tepidarius]BBG27091.1 hypothetical protein IC007_1621 [Sulfuracidifex tepidarius]